MVYYNHRRIFFMAKGIKVISKKSMSLKNSIVECKRPEIVYIPLVNHSKLDCECLVKIGDRVLKGSIVGRRNDNIELPIHSSVSGKVIGIEEKYYLNGEKVNCVVIENDFMEKQENFVGCKSKIEDYSKENFIECLKRCAVTGMGGSDFPTYIKYKGDLNTIVINAIECEPYITSDQAMINLHAEEILEAIDAIMEINKIDKGVIAIKENNTAMKSKFETYLGTYPKIKIALMRNVYPMGWERLLIKEALGIEYDKLPGEKGIVVNNASTIYAIYKALKEKKPVSNRIVTITGEALKNPVNVLVKIGTSIKDVMKELDEYNGISKIRFIAGGPMMGDCLPTDDLIVTKNLNCVLVIEDSEEEDLPCIRCGRCVEACPASICPVLIKDNIKDYEALKYLHPEKCIECGLCSYICPSKIKVRESVREAKKEIRRH
jgi:electron transport complex protein RnfC